MSFLTFVLYFIASSFILEMVSEVIVIVYKVYLINKVKKTKFISN